ncbi:unnamed protein product [Citrullus colocynthis]|uniref:Uncharacterized protein n=1 Tax=Citrullus colocynthis TaxID=252529 RepID=A0ABP0XU09_9ROSI
MISTTTFILFVIHFVLLFSMESGQCRLDTDYTVQACSWGTTVRIFYVNEAAEQLKMKIEPQSLRGMLSFSLLQESFMPESAADADA